MQGKSGGCIGCSELVTPEVWLLNKLKAERGIRELGSKRLGGKTWSDKLRGRALVIGSEHYFEFTEIWEVFNAVIDEALDISGKISKKDYSGARAKLHDIIHELEG